MSNLMKPVSKQVMASSSLTGAAGKGMVVAGGAGISLWLVAGLLPFITLPMLFVALVVGGIFLWE